jgi:hypothetical protein
MPSVHLSVVRNVPLAEGAMSQSICCDDIVINRMPSILIQLDEPLLRSLNRVAPAAKRQRAEFIRQAVRDAIRKREYEAIREAYLRQPDSPHDADDWSNADEWKP